MSTEVLEARLLTKAVTIYRNTALRKALVWILASINEPITLAPLGERRLIPTGLKIALPGGTEAQVRPDLTFAYKHGITVLNSPGTIDADYRGDVGVITINHGKEPFVIENGERIAQLVSALDTFSYNGSPSQTFQTLKEAVVRFGSTGVK